MAFALNFSNSSKTTICDKFNIYSLVKTLNKYLNLSKNIDLILDNSTKIDPDANIYLNLNDDTDLILDNNIKLDLDDNIKLDLDDNINLDLNFATSFHAAI